ncbi:alpha/beta hydrolase family protein [Chitinophaga sp. 212800010-3]|uniref:alpha/beta hydrolase n=1 Tax=unclassified Chitinophaga TaxID=2619133 RepID=UPI002DE4FCF0|nr:Alpha/beta hydrolase [Chitinophaga sp. 212800010-3]
MQKHLYLISGLGADERIFNNLRFPAGYQVHYLPWIAPEREEPIGQYAARMAEGIRDDGPVSLLGVSFGGIMSLEINKHIPVKKTILVSSIKRTAEKPPYYDWVKRLGIHKLPDQLLYQRRNIIVRKFLNIESPEERNLVNEYLGKRDFTYMRWAVNAILHWENEDIPPGLVHIHGAKDMPFPLKYLKPTHLIPDGGHFMVLNRAGVINQILAQEL